MRKTLFLLAAAALSLVGCNKDAVNEIGGEGAVTFTVLTEGAVTKASADGDGAGAKIDEVKVAVYMKTNSTTEPYKLYDNPDATYVPASKSATFTVNMIKNQTYQIVVWADKSGSYDFNNTLQSITRNSDVSKSCNMDDLDAFYASVEYNQATATATDRVITARRPFAQLNLITTDLKTGFVPGEMTVTYKAPLLFNAFDGTTGPLSLKTVKYKADEPYSKTPAAQNTLVMDYLFASKEGDVLSEVVMTAQLTETITDTFNNIPVKRNFRTNVIGALLTDPTDFTVNVNADWDTPETEIEWKTAENIAAANEILSEATAGQNLNINVNVPDDAATTNVQFTSSNSDSDVAMKFGNHSEGTPLTITFAKDAASTVNPASVTVEAPAGTTLVFETETHVVINGTDYGVISGTFSASTLVINKGVNVQKIIMTAGGLEIHGNVEAFEAAADHGEIIVRECEGLSTEVKDALLPFLASNYEVVANGSRFDIRKKIVVSVNGVEYTNLQDAIDAASNGSRLVIANDFIADPISIPAGKELILDLNGKTVTTLGNASGIWATVSGFLKLEGDGYLGDSTHDNVGFLFMLIGKLEANATATFESGLECVETRTTASKLYVHAGHWIGGVYDGRVWTFNKLDTAKAALIEVDGGTFYKFNPAEAQTEYPYENWVKEGYQSVYDEATQIYSVVEVPVVAKIGDKEYTSLESAIKAATEEDVIELFEGTYTTYGTTYAKNKTLHFKGQGDKTVWKYGKDSAVNGEGGSDYSFEGSTITFEDLTLEDNFTVNSYYRGFVRPASLTFESCTLKSMMGYLGIGDVHFTGCTFDVASACEYAVKCYSGKDFYFDGCTFNGNNKANIQLYIQDKSETVHYVQVKDCKFYRGTDKSRTAVYYYDQGATEGGIWEIHLDGDNKNLGEIAVNSDSGSWLWGSMKNNTPNSKTKVYEDETLVWANGVKQQ